MRKRTRIALVVALLLVAGLVSAGVSMYFASQHVPSFYREAIARNPEVEKKSSDELLRQASALASDIQQHKRWQVLFTADQINGWLAVDCREHFPDLLPPEVHDPRIAIRQQEATLAFRFTKGAASTVFSLSFDVYLAAPNVIALRIERARAGRMPVPLADVLETIGKAADALEIPFEWRQIDGDPVVLVTVPPSRSHKLSMQLDSIELHDGKVFLTGSSLPGDEIARGTPATARDETLGPKKRSGVDHPEVAGSASKRNRQR